MEGDSHTCKRGRQSEVCFCFFPPLLVAVSRQHPHHFQKGLGALRWLTALKLESAFSPICCRRLFDVASPAVRLSASEDTTSTTWTPEYHAEMPRLECRSSWARATKTRRASQSQLLSLHAGLGPNASTARPKPHSHDVSRNPSYSRRSSSPQSALERRISFPTNVERSHPAVSILHPSRYHEVGLQSDIEPHVEGRLQFLGSGTPKSPPASGRRGFLSRDWILARAGCLPLALTETTSKRLHSLRTRSRSTI